MKLTGIPMIAITGADSEDFLVTSHPDSPILKNEETTFSIKILVKSARIFSAIVSIENNDTEKNPYKFTVTGTGIIAPEMNIKQGSNDISSGNGKYNFGKFEDDNLSSAVEFTIENLGTSTLHLTGSPDLIEIKGNDSPMFQIEQTSTDSSILPGSSSTFKIKFDPSKPRYHSAIVSIANNDSDENPYTFTVAGIRYTKGDFNGYGFQDIVVGAPLDDDRGESSGCAFIYFGREYWTWCIEARFADVKIIGASSGDKFAYSVASAGDVNDDGFDDIIIGAPYNDSNTEDSGSVYIIFGKHNWSSQAYAVNANVKFVGRRKRDNFGLSVSSAGDINNDGFADVIIGAPGDDDGGDKSGCAYIYFGRETWDSLIATYQADVKIISKMKEDYFGNNVANAGDVNNDGIQDVIIGSRGNYGHASLFFGRNIWIEEICASNADVSFYGETTQDKFCCSVSSAGDVNNDGFDDIIIGAINNNEGGTRAGSAYIYFGNENMKSFISAKSADVKLISNDDESMFGISVSSAGDVNNDGYDDVIVGAPKYITCCALLFFGCQNWDAKIHASNADVLLRGNSFNRNLGCCVSSAGDINNDGIDDVLVGAYKDRRYHSDGGVYTFFGRKTWNQIIASSQAEIIFLGEDEGDWFGFSISGGK
ncbi:MAG: choice-of-anchor D domain-containing protein [Planctomycetes bacterium]|nr:choice-of-anchor D domain-containing protein [Planctomycetota bacterium]